MPENWHFIGFAFYETKLMKIDGSIVFQNTRPDWNETIFGDNFVNVQIKKFYTVTMLQSWDMNGLIFWYF